MNLYEKCPVCHGLGFKPRGIEDAAYQVRQEQFMRYVGKQPEYPEYKPEKCPACEGKGWLVSQEGSDLLLFIARHYDSLMDIVEQIKTSKLPDIPE